MKLNELLLLENYNDLRRIVDNELMNRSSIELIWSDVYRLISDVIHPEYEYLIQEPNPASIYQNIVRTTNYNFEPPYNDVSRVVGMLNRSREQEERSNFFEALYVAIKDLSDRKRYKEEKENYDVIHKSSNFIVFIPHSKEASCKLGSGTKWCISARGDRNYFDRYNQGNDIYIIHTRNDKYAIIVDYWSREIKEIQLGENSFKDVNKRTLSIFSYNLKEDGVDIEELEDVINVELTVPYGNIDIAINDINIERQQDKMKIDVFVTFSVELSRAPDFQVRSNVSLTAEEKYYNGNTELVVLDSPNVISVRLSKPLYDELIDRKLDDFDWGYELDEFNRDLNEFVKYDLKEVLDMYDIYLPQE